MAIIEKLSVKDTFTNWRDKINAIADVAVLAPMADENGIMTFDMMNCNVKEVHFAVPVKMLSDFDVKQVDNTGPYTSSMTVDTEAGTVEAALQMTSTENYIPWASGRTANGTMSMWTSMFDEDIHFSYVDLSGELVNTFSWDPDTNIISATVEMAAEARSAQTADTLQLRDLTGSNLPTSYPVFFGTVDGPRGSGAWDSAITYTPRTETLSVPKISSYLDGTAKTSETAAKWTALRRITLTEDAAGFADVDGSSDVNLPCILTASGVIPGQYGPAGNITVPRTNRIFNVPSFRVDEKGRVTEAFTRTITFPFPEVDVDSNWDDDSLNPVQNRVIKARFDAIDAIMEHTPDDSLASTTAPGLMSASDKAKLNDLTQYPRIKGITATTKDIEGNIPATDTKNVSTSVPTVLNIVAEGGLSAVTNLTANGSLANLTVALSVDTLGVAGSGLASEDGKITAPEYVGATATKKGTSGIVPAATAAEMNLFLNGAGEWADPIGTTYDRATEETDGLMSSDDKAKLNAISEGAVNVSIARTLTSGSKIATVYIDGSPIDLYGDRNTDTTYEPFTGATASAAGTAGLVPAPAKAGQNKYLRGDATWQTGYDAAQIDSKFLTKADLASPSFTGTPKAPTAAAGTSTDQIATTSFVSTAAAGIVGANCPEGLDTLTEIAASLGNKTDFKGYVDTGLNGKVSTTSSGYVKSIAVSGTTLTVTRGDNSTVKLTTQDTNTTYVNFVKSGSTAAAGLVPKPPTTAGSTKYLCENGTWAVPAMNANDKVTNTLNNGAKAYITGTTSGSTNTGGQVFDSGVFLTTAAGTLQATKFVGALQGNADSATKLATARTINGVSFNGTANITVADSTKVAKAGDTMTGNLVIKKATPSTFLQHTSVSKGSNPSSAMYWCFPLVDSKGTATANRLGLVETSLATNGNVSTYLRAYQNTSGSTTGANLVVTYEKGGTAYATCPQAAAGDRSTKIATTKWVGNLFHFSTSAPSNSTGANGDLWYQYV